MPNKNYRRYEILLPRRFNDGRAVPEDLLQETFKELETRFPVSAERQSIVGAWHQGDRTYRDESLRLFVDAPATPDNDAFFAGFKQTLQKRFQQKEIWITSHDICVI